MTLRRRLYAPVLAASGLAVVGCGSSDAVTVYQVPKAATGKTAPAAEAGPFRILGAMFPADNPVWFFKLTGSAAALAEQQEAFDKFLASVRFPKGPDALPEWDLPPGWRPSPQKSQFVDAVVLLGPDDKPLRLTVSRASGGVQGNVDRWAGQVGAATGPENLPQNTRPVSTASGAAGLRVDVTGPTNPGGGRGPMMGGR